LQHHYPISTEEKLQLSGEAESFLIQIEDALGVKFLTREPGLTLISSNPETLELAHKVVTAMQQLLSRGHPLSLDQISALLSMETQEENSELDQYFTVPLLLDKIGRPVLAKSRGQAKALDALQKYDLTFLCGAAGTGKTFLAVAKGVQLFNKRKIEKIVLVRPAVESGENLGFLPGDMGNKIAPYMTPLMDALHSMASPEMIRDWTDTNRLEIAPLAYMRGRTLSDCFVILDEAQNTTIAQMKMFLTRMGRNSKVVITGDESQKDLPGGKISGLSHALNLFANHPHIAQIKLTVKDVVRHRLVRDIIEAYEKAGIN